MAEINTSDLEELIIKNTPVTDAPSSGEATGGKPETAGGPGAEIDLALAELNRAGTVSHSKWKDPDDAGSHAPHKKRFPRWPLIAVLLLAAACAAVWFLNRFTITVTPMGPNPAYTEYGEIYQDMGATARYSGSIIPFFDRDLDVMGVGEIDTNTLGTYEMHYTSSYKNAEGTAVRTVIVRDATPPQIELRKEEGYYTLPNEEYEEEGFTATDNYDGDLTDQVERTVQEGQVLYTVSDSSGNIGIVTREIPYNDPEPPEITLDDIPTRIAIGSEWEDSYSAEDNVDGDLTDRVEVEGEVDTETEGEYTLTYRVSDSWGNEAVAERTVEVVDEVLPVEGEKIIFLTFDDGPGKYTDELLDILADHDVKATFFVTAQFKKYLDCIAREAEEGHAVAVHTYSHDFADVYESDEAYWEDFEKMNDIVEEQTGERADIFRFPGGASNRVSARYSEGIMTRLTEQAPERGLDYFDWNVSSGDAGGTTESDQVCENMKNGVKKHDISVILCHDIKGYTVDCMDEFLDWALDEGYTFMTLKKGIYTCHHHLNN